MSPLLSNVFISIVYSCQLSSLCPSAPCNAVVAVRASNGKGSGSDSDDEQNGSSPGVAGTGIPAGCKHHLQLLLPASLVELLPAAIAAEAAYSLKAAT